MTAKPMQLVTEQYTGEPARAQVHWPSVKPSQPVSEPVRRYNNVSEGRRARGYQKQLAKALRLIREDRIKPNNRQICEYCSCGSKVGARILSDLVRLYPAEFERTETGRVRYKVAA